MGKILHRNFKFEVPTSGKRVTASYKVDNNVAYVTAIAITSDRPKQPFYRGAQEIRIGADEVYPPGHESKMLMRGFQSATKYEELGQVAIPNGNIEVNYQDTDTDSVTFEPYTVTVHLRLELE